MISGLNAISFLFVFVVALIHGRVYETDDAIVVEVDHRPARMANSRFLDGTLGVKVSSIDINQPQLVTQDDPACLTFDRSPGICISARLCYPYSRLFQTVLIDATWIIGTRGTCNYVEPDGKLFYGVCCRSGFSNPANNLTTNKEVGKIANNADTRIVNGEAAYKGEYPFMVGIESNGVFLCGGSLLDNMHVLTAAHCVNTLRPQDVAKLNIFMGVADLKDGQRVTRRAFSITRHKDFNVRTLHNDVALITLSTPVDFSSHVSPVCLSSDGGAKHDGMNAVTIGWGKLREDGPRADTLQKVSLQIKSNEDCRKNFGTKAPGGIADHMICASLPGKDSCGGDSGGPLLINNCQVGIVSWGIGCATDTYGVYTRISSFQAWINRNKSRT